MNTKIFGKFTIRKFYTKDRNAVISLWKEVFPNDPPWNDPAQIISRKLRKQRALFLVGILETKVIATVIGGYDGFRGWIYHLAVHPKNRNQGIGKKMVAAIELFLSDQGCIKINLQVRASNPGVVRFYETIGYKTEDHTSMGKRL